MKNFTDKILLLSLKLRGHYHHGIVIESVKSDVAKELHQEGMYTEKEVLTLIEDYVKYYYSTPSPTDTAKTWFEEHKKKIEL